MAYKIITNSDANGDISNYFEYYQKIAGRKVAEYFFRDFKNALSKLKKVTYYQKIHNDFHRLPLKIFPFIIIYKVDKENEIIKISESSTPHKILKNIHKKSERINLSLFIFINFENYIASILKVILSITFRIASTVSIDVRQGTPFSTDILRIWKPSLSDCFPFVVVFTRYCTLPF